MPSTRKVQKELTEALKPLKNHPEANSLLADLKKKDFFDSYLPYENQLQKMSEKEREKIKDEKLQYYKGAWIIANLIEHDPSILEDKKSIALKKVFTDCLSVDNQLQEIFGVSISKPKSGKTL